MPAAADAPGSSAVPTDFHGLVKLARAGDLDAKHELVNALQRLVWHTIADFGLSHEDRQDVFTGTFCRLFERLDTIREPDRLPGWIATTARNEAHTLLRSRGRYVLEGDVGERVDHDSATDTRLLERELRAALRAAFVTLPQQCRELLRLVTAVPRLSYDEIGDLLSMPHGSIGPTRQRCLDRLRSAPPLRPFRPEARS